MHAQDDFFRTGDQESAFFALLFTHSLFWHTHWLARRKQMTRLNSLHPSLGACKTKQKKQKNKRQKKKLTLCHKHSGPVGRLGFLVFLFFCFFRGFYLFSKSLGWELKESRNIVVFVSCFLFCFFGFPKVFNKSGVLQRNWHESQAKLSKCLWECNKTPVIKHLKLSFWIMGNLHSHGSALLHKFWYQILVVKQGLHHLLQEMPFQRVQHILSL